MSWLVCMLSACCSASPIPNFIAHRGESFDAPENTMAAFRLAWERQVPEIELDVHLSKDGRLVVCHDPDTKRVTGTKLAIKETDSSRLLGLDVGAWKDERWKGERMPTLEEALATIPDKGRCLIEVKVGPEAVPALVKAVKESGKRANQFAIISFKAATVREAKRQLPELEAYYVSGFKRDKVTGVWTPTVDELIQEAKAIRADGLDLSFEGPLAQEDVQRIKSAGLKFFVWTVDDPVVAKKYAQWGADGITSNRAAWLKEQLRGNHQ